MRGVDVMRFGVKIASFERLNDAAEFIGINPTSARVRILKGSIIDGWRLVYNDNDIGHVRFKLKRAEKCDELTDEETEQRIVEAQKKGKFLEKIPYRLRNGVEIVTACSKDDFINTNDRPKVGSVRCMECRHFQGRNRDKKIVLCSHASKWMEKYAKKGARKAI